MLFGTRIHARIENNCDSTQMAPRCVFATAWDNADVVRLPCFALSLALSCCGRVTYTIHTHTLETQSKNTLICDGFIVFVAFMYIWNLVTFKATNQKFKFSCKRATTTTNRQMHHNYTRHRVISFIIQKIHFGSVVYFVRWICFVWLTFLSDAILIRLLACYHNAIPLIHLTLSVFFFSLCI